MPTIGAASPEVGLTRERIAEYTIIAISGELDLASTPSLRERLHVALRDVGAHVVIDLSDVTFCDASGLAMLVGARRRAERRGITVTLAAPRPQLVRLLQVTGLCRAFAVRPSVTAARIAGRSAQAAAA